MTADSIYVGFRADSTRVHDINAYLVSSGVFVGGLCHLSRFVIR